MLLRRKLRAIDCNVPLFTAVELGFAIGCRISVDAINSEKGLAAGADFRTRTAQPIGSLRTTLELPAPRGSSA